MQRSKWIRAVGIAALACGLAVLTSTLPASAASTTVAATTVKITSSVNPTVSGQRTVLAASISDPLLTAAQVSGSVSFSDGATPLGTVAVTNARATLAVKTLAAGTHDLSAAFTPTGGTPIVSAPLTQVVNQATTTVVVTSSNANAKYGAAGNLTATIKAVTPGTGVPTGSVDFLIDGSWYWNAPVDGVGKAVLPLSAVYPAYTPGTYSITAAYSGDGNYLASTTTATVAQTLVGISTQPVTTITTNAKGLPTFSPNSFTLSSANPVGCNVTITNNTTTAIALTYGTPGAWKRLPGGVIAPGASGGVGVGLSNFTGYFSAMGAANYVSVHCI